MHIFRYSFVLAGTLTLLPIPVTAHDDHSGHAAVTPEKLGQVSFPTSCKPAVSVGFNRAMALMHSFAYEAAAQAFAEVAARDPACAMAHWGVAMSQYHPIWGPPTEAEFAHGRAAASRAAAIATSNPKERDLIAAIGAFYRGDGAPHAQRVLTYEQAMAGVAKKHPADREVQILNALAILGVAYNSPPDKTYARQKRAAELLSRLMPHVPDHPGVAHYIIHAYDYPELAEKALPAALAYAKIAPSAPHALHMPSHIFTRLGMWQESIESNLASAEAAQRWLAKTKPGATAFDALHAWDYLTYAYLQLGQEAKARELVDKVSHVASFDLPQFAAGYALAAVPARFALERRAWREAAQLTPRPATFPWAKYPYAEALVHFTQAVGASRSGDLATARKALGRLMALQLALKGQKGFDWATQVEIHRRAAEGWLARAQEQDEVAVALLRSAADLEDSADKHPVTPGSLLPAREQLADLLAELGRPEQALAEYEASLRTAPGRLNSYLGALRAAERTGDEAKARQFRERVRAQTGGVVPARGKDGKGRL